MSALPEFRVDENRKRPQFSITSALGAMLITCDLLSLLRFAFFSNDGLIQLAGAALVSFIFAALAVHSLSQRDILGGAAWAALALLVLVLSGAMLLPAARY